MSPADDLKRHKPFRDSIRFAWAVEVLAGCQQDEQLEEIRKSLGA